MNIRLFLLTSVTMIAFAANSILCRIALTDSDNEPVSFTLIRLLAGAVVLIFFFFKKRVKENSTTDIKMILAPLMLFFYALFFSLSYVKIDTGTGALILFASVQFTMMITALVRGERFATKELLGVILAVAGFIYLLLPGANMPSMVSAVLMIIAGVSWGIYSLLGQNVKDPIYATSMNFVFTLPLVIFLLLVFPLNLTIEGITLAVLSGAITSGLGYILWYAVLKMLATSTAAIVQLTVPVLAAFGGVLILNEDIEIRLILSSLLILGGIFLKIHSKV